MIPTFCLFVSFIRSTSFVCPGNFYGCKRVCQTFLFVDAQRDLTCALLGFVCLVTHSGPQLSPLSRLDRVLPPAAHMLMHVSITQGSKTTLLASMQILPPALSARSNQYPEGRKSAGVEERYAKVRLFYFCQDPLFEDAKDNPSVCGEEKQCQRNDFSSSAFVLLRSCTFM